MTGQVRPGQNRSHRWHWAYVDCRTAPMVTLTLAHTLHPLSPSPLTLPSPSSRVSHSCGAPSPHPAHPHAAPGCASCMRFSYRGSSGGEALHSI